MNKLLSRMSAIAAFVILAVLIQVYAGMSLRGVYADGAHHVKRMLDVIKAIHLSLMLPLQKSIKKLSKPCRHVSASQNYYSVQCLA
jgi:hypothetical protein